MRLRKIRRLLAIVFFAMTTLLFLDFSGTIHHWFGWMAKVQLIPALLATNAIVVLTLLVLTLIFGRIYCSVVCPLGVFQDIVARITSVKNKHKYTYSKAKSFLRYTMLVVFVGLFIAGLNSMFALLEPYSAYGRIASNLFAPLYIMINNGLAYLAERIDSYAFYSVDIWLKGIVVFVVALVTFIVVALLSWKGGRTYCNTICPVGTILSLFARFSLYKIRFDEQKCKKCSKCTKACKASCIDYNTQKVDYSRCVVCGNCLEECRFGALHYELRKKKSATPISESASSNDAASCEEPVNTTRRSFLLSTALLSATAFAQDKIKLDGGLAELKPREKRKRETPLTPPGALSAQNFAQHCTACQLCIAECPNDVLRPSIDWQTLMQPVMSYERGFCRQECVRCSEVCPTGAIRLITREQKSSTQIGHAHWQGFNCIVLSDEVECGNCSRHCPSGAIEMVPLRKDDADSPLVPSIDEEYCIGCGACEYVCPARPLSAIYVEGHEVHKEIQ